MVSFSTPLFKSLLPSTYFEKFRQHIHSATFIDYLLGVNHHYRFQHLETPALMELVF